MRIKGNQKISYERVGIGLVLIGLLSWIWGCSHALKAPDSRYDFQTQGEGFIYGKLEIQNRNVTQIHLVFENELNRKIKTYSRDFSDHLFGRREDDFALRIPIGNWKCTRIELGDGKAVLFSKAASLSFQVESERGSYLGSWILNPQGDVAIHDDKAIQDGKIAEAYPRFNLNATLNAIPKNSGVMVLK